jgi:trimethylamine---corrinoid protein Co-methyltransferase
MRNPWSGSTAPVVRCSNARAWRCATSAPSQTSRARGRASRAKTLDGQWAAETALTTVAAAQMGASLLHDVGEFEAGVQDSLESLVLGDAMVGYARRLVAGIRVDDETLQLDDIDAVGPGGSYLARPYTRAHHRALWRSDLFGTATHERWVEEGSPVLLDRLRDAVAGLLARREPVLDEAVAARLDAFWRAA